MSAYYKGNIETAKNAQDVGITVKALFLFWLTAVHKMSKEKKSRRKNRFHALNSRPIN